MDCFFCACVSGREPAAVVYQDELVLAMMAPGPANPGHVLITPTQHIERLGGMEEEAGIHLFRIAMRMQRAIENSIVKCEGTYLGLAEGVGSFHIVPHLYIDLVPRFRDDRYEILATIDRPYDQPDALLRHLFDDRVRRWPGKARRANEVDPSLSRIDDVAAEIRNSYAAIWGGLA
jgi:histidine triad (HIT) family protein